MPCWGDCTQATIRRIRPPPVGWDDVSSGQPLRRGVGERHGMSESAHFFMSRSLSMCSLNVSKGSAPDRNLTALTSEPSAWVYPRKKAGVPLTPAFWPSLRLALIFAVYLPLSRQAL